MIVNNLAATNMMQSATNLPGVKSLQNNQLDNRMVQQQVTSGNKPRVLVVVAGQAVLASVNRVSPEGQLDITV